MFVSFRPFVYFNIPLLEKFEWAKYKSLYPE